MAYPYDAPATEMSGYWSDGAYTPSQTVVYIRNNVTPINKNAMVNSVGKQLSLIQNFVNNHYLARQNCPIGKAYINKLYTSGTMYLEDNNYYTTLSPDTLAMNTKIGGIGISVSPDNGISLQDSPYLETKMDHSGFYTSYSYMTAGTWARLENDALKFGNLVGGEFGIIFDTDEVILSGLPIKIDKGIIPGSGGFSNYIGTGARPFDYIYCADLSTSTIDYGYGRIKHEHFWVVDDKSETVNEGSPVTISWDNGAGTNPYSNDLHYALCDDASIVKIEGMLKASDLTHVEYTNITGVFASGSRSNDSSSITFYPNWDGIAAGLDYDLRVNAIYESD